MEVELFGTLRLVCGGKHGYVGVRGGQGKQHNKFQAYVTVDSKKLTVPGLYESAHEAAVALAQFKMQRELGLEEEPAEKKQRKRRRSMAAEEPPTAAGSTSCSRWARVPLQPLTISSPLPPFPMAMLAPPTVTAYSLPAFVPATAYGVPVVYARPADNACGT